MRRQRRQGRTLRSRWEDIRVANGDGYNLVFSQASNEVGLPPDYCSCLSLSGANQIAGQEVSHN
jgi:hypothetical protein